MRIKHLHKLTFTLGLLTLSQGAACFGSTNNAAPSQGPSQPYAIRHTQEIAQVEPGELRLWLGDPLHVLGHVFVPLHRGNTAQFSDVYGGGLSTSSSKILWSRKHEHNALLNYLIPGPQGAKPLFEVTPAQIVEFAFLAPLAPQTPQAATTTVELTPKQADPTAPTAQLLIHSAPIAAPAPTGPIQVSTAQSHTRVSATQPHWELPGLNEQLVLACVVVAEPVPKDNTQEKTQRFRGQLWIKSPHHEAPAYVHSDPRLEPSAWRIRDDDSASLEVIMSDREGWPKRVDLIDLNTRTSTTIVDEEAIKALGL